MKKLVFDLDGVFRDLNAYLEPMGVPYAKEWKWKHQGWDIFQWIKSLEYAPLKLAPPTPYLEVALYYIEKIEIWTCQPNEWRPFTNEWLEREIPNADVHYLKNQEKRTRLDYERNTWLVEDSPGFTSYERIILIDRPYNRNVKAQRVLTPDELEEVLIDGNFIKRR